MEFFTDIFDQEFALFFILFVVIAYVRGKNHNAVRKLTPEWKSKLFQKFVHLRILQTIGQITSPITIILLYQRQSPALLYAIVFLFMIIFYTFGYAVFIKRLKAMSFPKNFLDNYFLDRYWMIAINMTLILYALVKNHS